MSKLNVKISVAMTTYNGEKYIIEQLDSIRNQTLPPNEVIICDDQSTDDTADIIKKYISDFQLDNWKFQVNNKRLGWKENFREAIRQTSGEIVFFSDQDDVWFLNKIENMSTMVDKYDMGCLYGDCVKIDSNGDFLPNQRENIYDKYLNKIEFGPSFYNVGGLGCCMCVRRRVIDKYLNLNLKEDDHDSQCPRIAVYYDSLWYVNSPMIKYRVHSQNTSNVTSGCPYGVSSKEYRISLIKRILEWLEIVGSDDNVDYLHKKYVKQAIMINKKRFDYLTQKDVNWISLVKCINSRAIIQSLVGDFAYRHGWENIFGKVLWKMEMKLDRLK